MADENTPAKKTAYHMYAQLSKTYFSYKKPGDDKAYAFMYVQYHNNMLTLHFRKSITSENTVDLNCYLPDAKAYDLANLFEGMMARRRVAYENGQNYDSDEVKEMVEVFLSLGSDELRKAAVEQMRILKML